ncbi:retrotransposon protein, putative, ty1-copia subclass [Tanacetum coccineum]
MRSPTSSPDRSHFGLDVSRVNGLRLTNSSTSYLSELYRSRYPKRNDGEKSSYLRRIQWGRCPCDHEEDSDDRYITFIKHEQKCPRSGCEGFDHLKERWPDTYRKDMGYTQLYGVDYEETFSPVADIKAIRILISIATFYDYEIWQMDVKTAFLNGYLDEDIYIVQPEGFIDPNHPRKASGSNVTFLILYVDDIIIIGNHIPSLQSVKDYLGKCFAMKDLGEAAFILRIKIYRDMSKRLIRLGQNTYMDKILKRYKMDNSKCGHIPMQEILDLNKTQGASTPKEVKRMQNVPYASAVGSIMYAVRRTRPDVAFAQNITSRFQQNPGELHWTVVKNILKYLKNTKDMFLVYGAVDWKSSKQSTTAMSATEAEYIDASEAVMEAVWIRKFISGLDIKGARHYHRRYHYVRESIALGKIRFLKVHTDDNMADPFTKALSKGNLTQHARSMGLRLASSFM